MCGNHEFYGKRPMPTFWREASQKVSGTHVHLLENNAVILDGVRFLGATLWTDFCLFGAARQELAMQSAQTGMNDYVQIVASEARIRRVNEMTGLGRYVGDPLTTRATLAMHEKSRAFLEDALAAGQGDKTVVVTHHAPSAKSLRHGDPRGLLDAAYASHLDHLVDRAALWIHGHTHFPVDYRIGAGRVVSNPRGYARYETIARFDPGFVIEV
ncbi:MULTISPECIES: phosphoesterase [unclassified Achromobacter]|uniref:phosphoesterase n=1 Tax=unclassified Achromobacter TaxID=2626865 RepID=UPI00130367C9|nr:MULTISPECIES: phosphoesterase [unclassified Achromobacter]